MADGFTLKGKWENRETEGVIQQGKQVKAETEIRENSRILFCILFCFLVRALHIIYTLRPIPEIPGHHQGLICTYEPSLIQKGAQWETFPGFPFQTNKEAKWSARVS